MTPITREELFLAKLSGETVTTPNPITREELFLAKLCGENVETPEPITRIEFFLDSLAGNEHPWLTPMTRLEYFIAAAGGADVPELTPITREEMYWSSIEISGVDWTTVTGAAPLALADALAKPIKKLIQFGKVATVDNETYCNNGKLVAVDDELPSGYERQIGFEFAAATYYLIQDFHLRGSDTVRLSFSVDKACNVFGCYTTNSASDNYSLYASTSSGSKYLRYDGATYNSYIPSAQTGERIDVAITPTGTTGMPTDSVITPAEFEATADLCIGTTSTSASSSKLDGNLWGNFEVDGRLTLIPCERLSDNVLGYYDQDSDTFYEPIGSAPTSLGVDTSHLTVLSVVGTPEVLTVGEQTASVANLFDVDDIKDEHNIISGTVTRRCEAVISDGTTPSGRYIGTVGDGNIIVKVRETGYEGDVATFEADRAEPLNGLTVNVEPIQDLHSYDSPWPAGGGVNKFGGEIVVGKRWQNGSYVTASTDNYAASEAIINCSPSTEYCVTLPDITETTAFYCVEFDANGNYIRMQSALSLTQNNNAKVFSTSADAYKIAASFYCASPIQPASIAKFAINYPSTITTWSPYANICPISGRTSATVTRTGINIFDKSEVVDNTYINDNNGTARSANGSKCTGWISVVPGEKYYILTEQTEGSWGSWYDRNKSFIGPINEYRSSGSQKEQTAPSNAAYMRLTCVRNGSGNIDTFSVNYPSTDHDYHPYQGNTYTIQLGQTVYGGTLDVTGGKFVGNSVIWARNTATMDNNENYPGWQNSGIKSLIGGGINEILGNQIMNIGTTYGANTSGNNDVVFLPVAGTASYGKTQTEWKALAIDVQIVIPLATPIEINLTPTQIETLLGTNNIWSDAGAVKAYVADGDVIEHVTAQPMQTAEGSNTVSVASAVDPVQLEVIYAKAGA